MPKPRKHGPKKLTPKKATTLLIDIAEMVIVIGHTTFLLDRLLIRLDLDDQIAGLEEEADMFLELLERRLQGFDLEALHRELGRFDLTKFNRDLDELLGKMHRD